MNSEKVTAFLRGKFFFTSHGNSYEFLADGPGATVCGEDGM